MASCHKCGKAKIRKRKDGRRRCARCGDLPSAEITLNGRKPANPWGSCFDSAAALLIGIAPAAFSNPVMCHGVCISNMPGQEGERIAHAWVEADHAAHGRVAIDPIWLIAQPVDHYRKNLKPESVVTYDIGEFMALWREHNYPGPWDEGIRKFTTEGKAA